MTHRFGSGALLFAALALGATPGASQTWRTVTSARQLHGETSLAVDVTYTAGEFRMTPGAEGSLYRMEVRYDEDRFTPVREYDPEAATLRLGVRSRGGRITLGDRNRRSGRPPSLDLALTPDIPLDLNMELGAVRADIEFGGLALRRVRYRTGASESAIRFSRPNPVTCDELRLEAGAAEFRVSSLGNANCRRMQFKGGVGDVTLDFGGRWRASTDADVDVAIGSLALRLPRDLGVAIRVDRFLASFDRTGFTKRGTVYYSDNYDSARYRLSLNVRAAIGGIDVAWVEPER